MTSEALLVVVFFAVVFVAGIVTGISALGFAQITAAALAIFGDPHTAVVILAVTVPVISGLQIVHHRHERLPARRLIPLLAGAAVGVPIGIWLLSILSSDAIAALVGGSTLAYVAIRLLRLRPRIRSEHEPVIGPIAGVGAGLLNGTIGVSGPVVVPYLLAIELPPATFGYAVSVVYVCMTVGRLVGLVATAELVPQTALLGAALLVPALVGQRVGFVLRPRLSSAAFERLVLGTLVLAGVSLIGRLFGL